MASLTQRLLETVIPKGRAGGASSRLGLADAHSITPQETGTLYSAFTVPNQSLFFTRLPLEIRQLILEEAFGSRNLHLWRTSSVFSEAHRRQSSGAKAVTSPRILRNNVAREEQQIKTSDRWISCVCQRAGELEPVYDCCFDDHDRPSIGALGWLLTCRQAFAEGISVLCSTNTFHLRDEHTLDALVAYFPVTHLTLIRSVEVVLKHIHLHDVDVMFEKNDGWADHDPGALKMRDHFAHLGRTLPNLQQVYITFGTSLLPTGIAARLTAGEHYIYCRDVFMPLMDKLIGRYGRAWEVEVGVPYSFYQGYRRLYWNPRVRRSQTPLWWDVTPGETRKESPLGGWHVRERVFREAQDGTGYWVSQSWEDLRLSAWMVMAPWWGPEHVEEIYLEATESQPHA